MTIVVDVALNPADPTQGYQLFSTGIIRPFGGALPVPSSENIDVFTGGGGDASTYSTGNVPYWPWGSEGPARALAVVDWADPSGYTMGYDGGVWAWGPNADPPASQRAGYPEYGAPANFYDAAMDPAGNGEGYVLPFSGDIREIGGAPNINDTGVAGYGNGPGSHHAVKLTMDYASGEYYVLSSWGAVYAGNGATPITSLDWIPDGTASGAITIVDGQIPFPNFDIFRDFAVYDFPTGKGWVLDGNGVMRATNGAQRVPFMVERVFSPGASKWIRLEVIDDGTGANPLTLLAASVIGELPTVYVSTAPTVTVSAPASTQTTTTRPLITWEYSDAEGDAQDDYAVRVFSAAQFGIGGFDAETSPATWETSGTSRSASSVVVGVDLPNDTWRAYVRSSDTSGLFSLWNYIEWIQNTTPPETPVLVAVAGATALDGNTLTATATGIEPSALIGFQYRDGVDDSWKWVRDGSGVETASDVAVLVDREARFGVTRTYRAFSYLDNVTSILGSEFSNEDDATITDLKWILSNPTDETQIMRVSMTPEYSYTRLKVSAEFDAVGRLDPIVVSDGALKTRRQVMNVRTLSRAVFDELEEMLEADSVLLLRNPFGEAVFFALVPPGVDFALIRAQPTDDEDTAIRHAHEIAIPVAEVRRPQAGPASGPLSVIA